MEVAPFTIRDLFLDEDQFTPEDERQALFESLHTHTLYYLAQVYGKLEMSMESAGYCHVTLKRQLETKQYDQIEWSLNCATLAQYYLTVHDYVSARHCLGKDMYSLEVAGQGVGELKGITICLVA